MIGNKDEYGIKNAQYNAHEKTTNPSVWPCSEFSIIVKVIYNCLLLLSLLLEPEALSRELES